jgi:hypothetical protein
MISSRLVAVPNPITHGFCNFSEISKTSTFTIFIACFLVATLLAFEGPACRRAKTAATIDTRAGADREARAIELLDVPGEARLEPRPRDHFRCGESSGSPSPASNSFSSIERLAGAYAKA